MINQAEHLQLPDYVFLSDKLIKDFVSQKINVGRLLNAGEIQDIKDNLIKNLKFAILKKIIEDSLLEGVSISQSGNIQLDPDNIATLKTKVKSLFQKISNRVDRAIEIAIARNAYEYRDKLEPDLSTVNDYIGAFLTLDDYLDFILSSQIDPNSKDRVIARLREMKQEAEDGNRYILAKTQDPDLDEAIYGGLIDPIRKKYDLVIDYMENGVVPDNISPVDINNLGGDPLGRPEIRAGWTPIQYIAEMKSRLVKSKDLGEAGALYSEFKALISTPEYEEDRSYWKLAAACWDVIVITDPPSGSDDFTIDAGKLEGVQNIGFDRKEILEGLLCHKKYGPLAIKLLRLMEKMMSDPNFSVIVDGTVILEPGTFLSENLDRRGEEFKAKVEEIVAKDPEFRDLNIPNHVVTTTLDLAHATDMRGHFFLDKTADAVTKGFGGEDYTWLCRPEAVVGYDINRYVREPKASWYLLAAVSVPEEWSIEAAKGSSISDSVAVSYWADLSSTERSILVRGLSVSSPDLPTRSAIQETDRKVLIEKIKALIKEKQGLARVKQADEYTEDIRDWFGILIPEKSRKLCVSKAFEFKSNGNDLPVRERPDGNYEFREHGPTFPSPYQFLARFNEAELDMKVDPDTGEESWKLKDGKANALGKYEIAKSGWLTLLDFVKSAPKVVNEEELLRKLDDIHGALGKAKIVDGAHHNMMNVLLFLSYVKLFKYLEPRSYTNYLKVKNKALDKVDTSPAAASAGGLPAHVKAYLTWLLNDSGDVLRPMDPSSTDLIGQKVRKETDGLTGARKLWVSLFATLEGSADSLSTEKEKDSSNRIEIPEGPIKWEDQETSTKADSKK